MAGKRWQGFIDLTGKRFCRWVAIRPIRKPNTIQIFWLCKCQCGMQKTVMGNDLRHGKSKSCGCLRVETSRRNGLNRKRHAHARHGAQTREYRSWQAMRARCCYKKHE